MGTGPSDWSSLVPALFNFERAPGRYPVALREPRALFDQVGSVMLLAAGRPLPDLPPGAALEAALRRAARFFVRTVMLRPGANPFVLLGLRPGFAPAQLREHYRLMIRLTHPDFAHADEHWPADAATRVNLAKDLLASPEQRAACAAALIAPPGRHPVRLGAAPRLPRPWLPRPARAPGEGGSTWFTRARLTLVGSSALLMAGVFLLAPPRSEHDSAATAQDAETAPPEPGQHQRPRTGAGP